VDFGSSVTVGGTGWKKTYAAQARYRAEQFEKVLRFTASSECRMAALVRHFGDLEDASKLCGVCDVCDPAGEVLRLFRRATAVERTLALGIVEELRGVDYRAAGTLQRSLDPAGRMSRNEFDGLLGAMVRAGLVEIEEVEYEKDGEVRRFRKVRLTEAGLELRAATPVELLISDGMVEEFAGQVAAPARKKKAREAAGKPAETTAVPVQLSAEGEALVARLKEWRAAEAKRLGVPAYLVLYDRTVTALAEKRPGNPRELLEIDGIGPAKAEKFGQAILGICRSQAGS
jgi:superfamily II DNA helicase RecQ